MSDIRVAQDPDRLPWLTDERKPRRTGDRNALMLWALLAALLVGGVAYWFGMQSVTDTDEPVATAPAARPTATIPLPPPAVVQPRLQEVQPAPVPEVRPVPEPVVRIPAPEPVRAAKPHVTKPAAAKPEAPAVTEKSPAPAPAPVAKPAAVARPGPLRLWPASVSEGASGRVVRIGAYGSRLNAKKGWWQIVQRYPGMRRLRAVVAPVPAPGSGRTYYRLQFGTTSQAHSEVLCQRMHAIRKTCAVVGLPRG